MYIHIRLYTRTSYGRPLPAVLSGGRSRAGVDLSVPGVGECPAGGGGGSVAPVTDPGQHALGSTQGESAGVGPEVRGMGAGGGAAGYPVYVRPPPRGRGRRSGGVGGVQGGGAALGQQVCVHCLLPHPPGLLPAGPPKVGVQDRVGLPPGGGGGRRGGSAEGSGGAAACAGPRWGGSGPGGLGESSLRRGMGLPRPLPPGEGGGGVCPGTVMQRYPPIPRALGGRDARVRLEGRDVVLADMGVHPPVLTPARQGSAPVLHPGVGVLGGEHADVAGDGMAAGEVVGPLRLLGPLYELY